MREKVIKFPIKGAKVKDKVRSHTDPKQDCIPVGYIPPACCLAGGTEFLTHATKNITLLQTSFAGGKKRELIRDKKGEEFVLSKSHDEIRFVVSRSCAYSIFSSFFFVSRYLGGFCTFSGNLLEKKSCKFPTTGTKI